MKKNALVLLALLVPAGAGFAATTPPAPAEYATATPHRIVADVPYKSGDLTVYEQERCKLDIHLPLTVTADAKLPVLIHLYGGGLTSGDKGEAWNDWAGHFGERFLAAGVIVVSPNYRLGGQGAQFPDYIRDAAAAVAWVDRHIAAYGGDRRRIFVSGFSAGAYLALMLALDERWYGEIGFDPHHVAGYIALSGQTFTHSQVATERGIAKTEITDAAPLGHVGPGPGPLLLFAGSEEGQTIVNNRLLAERLQAAGRADVTFEVMPGRNHQAMVQFMGRAEDEIRARILAFITAHEAP